MTQLTLLRHGESIWNKKNLFTGWVDIPLSNKGICEAQQAGTILQKIPVDIVFCSTLIRAITTAMIALVTRSEEKSPIILHPQDPDYKKFGKICSKTTEQESIPVYLSSALNERMYGELQGLNKQETIERFGKEQVQIWRRSFQTPPPDGESLKMTMERTLPYFSQEILPLLQSGKNILIVAHGNSLRSIIKEIENISDEEIASYEIQTGVPITYSLEDSQFTRT